MSETSTLHVVLLVFAVDWPLAVLASVCLPLLLVVDSGVLLHASMPRRLRKVPLTLAEHRADVLRAPLLWSTGRRGSLLCGSFHGNMVRVASRYCDFLHCGIINGF